MSLGNFCSKGGMYNIEGNRALGIYTGEQVIAFSAIGMFGGIVTYAFGAWSELLSFFLLVMAMDYVTGIVASLKEGSGLNSSVGFWGIAKKGLVLLVIVLAHRIDILCGTNAVMVGAIYFYLANELVSIIENCGRMGVPLPEQVKELISALKRIGSGEQW